MLDLSPTIKDKYLRNKVKKFNLQKKHINVILDSINSKTDIFIKCENRCRKQSLITTLIDILLSLRLHSHCEDNEAKRS